MRRHSLHEREKALFCVRTRTKASSIDKSLKKHIHTNYSKEPCKI